jgi:Cu2+-exporting ATPase
VPEPELGSEVYAIGLGLGARVRGREVRVGGARGMKQHGLDPSCVAASLERVRAAHASSLMVAVDGRIEGVIGYADRLRDESPGIVSALRAGGRRRIVLLSGDAPGPVASVAKAVGADEFVAEMLPEDKAAYVKDLQKRGHTVAMVGDGINDAPALALSDVGISLHGGTDVALETADVVLLEGGLERIVVAFETGDRAMAMVRRGLGIVIAPNAAAIVLGALGLINPAIAAAVNNGTTVVAALSSLAPLLGATRPRGAGR